MIAIPPADTGRTQHLLEHRVVMEKMLGRSLFDDEQVHHRNGVRHDNQRRNLELKVKAHGSGIAILDAVTWAKEILRRYDS